jgi:integrase
MSRAPSYLLHTDSGIFYLQIRLPTCFLERNPHIPSLFRRSLRTRDKKAALQAARRWRGAVDSLAYKHFRSAAEFGKAMELLYQYEKLVAEKLDWREMEDSMLSFMEDGESKLLERAQHYVAERDAQRATPSSPVEIEKSSGSSRVDTTLPRKEETVAELVDRFIAHKRQSTKPSTVKSFEEKCRRFDRILTLLNDGRSPGVSQVDEVMIRAYRDLILGMPKHLSSDAEFARYVRNRTVKHGAETLSPVTAWNIFIMVGNFVEWIETEQYGIKPGLFTILRSQKKPKERDRGKRVAFEDEDLRKLFTSRQYRSNGFKRSSDHWLPLIALFTGATLSEIAQLHTDDILQIDGVWIIDINSKGNKELKNEDGRPRQVPVHSQLVALGFLEFVEMRRRGLEARLFPEEERNVHGAFDALSKRFNRYRESVGVTTETRAKKDFHSFRHTVASLLIGAGVEEGLVNDIVGHASSQRSETRRTYAKAGTFVTVKAQAIEKLKYDLPFDKIGVWRD